jgi:spore coat assembly protein SafA
MSDEKKEKSAAVNEAAPCPSSQLYTIKPGDTLYLIAKRFNISVASLHSANPQIVDPNVIYPGQQLVIPGLGTVPPAPCPSPRTTMPGPAPAPVIPPVAECPGGQIYRVVCGDTMFKIAQRFGVDLDTLIQANPQISDPNWIYPGQEICIPGAGAPPPCGDGVTYTVKAGDTLFNIARQYGVMLSDLIAANPQISDPDRIFPGQVICIPAPAIMPQPPELPAEYPEPPVALPPPLVPCPMPRPSAPAPCRPLPPAPAPCRPLPPAPVPCRPLPGEQPTMYPMPVYVVVPWDECPYRPKGKKKKKRKRKTCDCN